MSKGGRGRGRGPPREKKRTKDDLDAEMDAYFLKDKDVAKKKLDGDLDTYLAGKKSKEVEVEAAGEEQ